MGLLVYVYEKKLDIEFVLEHINKKWYWISIFENLFVDSEYISRLRFSD
jgi:hypothetical protein